MNPKHLQMMKQGVGIPVRLSGPSEKISQGEVRLQIWDKQARLGRALRFWGIFWGMCIVSVFIPLAHFILVPTFFLGGPIAAWIVSQKERAILGGQSTCPECGEFMPIAAAEDRWPLKDLCTHCYKYISIEKNLILP